MSVEVAILFGAGAATAGWLYTARRQRTLFRKQHTFNALLRMSFNEQFENRFKKLVPYVREGTFPNNNREIDDDILGMLNHYEFLAAGIRNGDIDELLLYDSEYGFILSLYEASQSYIERIRKARKFQDIYDHLDWLYKRWKGDPPGKIQQAAEFMWGRPFHDWPPKLKKFT